MAVDNDAGVAQRGVLKRTSGSTIDESVGRGWCLEYTRKEGCGHLSCRWGGEKESGPWFRPECRANAGSDLIVRVACAWFNGWRACREHDEACEMRRIDPLHLQVPDEEEPLLFGEGSAARVANSGR